MRRLFVIAAIVSATLLFAGASARATCCNADGDCPQGFTCLGGSCASTVADCMCDSDCPPNLYCVPGVATVCTQVAGSTTQDCHPLAQCMAAWQRPCATATDCGPGDFACVPNGRFCSGSDCQTTSTCMAPALPDTCATNADCPPAWTCEPDTAVVNACIPQAPHSCPASGCPQTPLTGTKSCVPPLYDLVGQASFTGPPVALPDTCPVKTEGDGAKAGGGCQMTPGASAGGTLLLAAWAFLGANLRRRAKRSRRPVGPSPRSSPASRARTNSWLNAWALLRRRCQR